MDKKTRSMMQECINKCWEVSRCGNEAIYESLKMGGKYSELEHLALIMNCVKICESTAQFVVSRSPFMQLLCGLCAKICEDCAEECEKIGDSPGFVSTCRENAVICKSIASGTVAEKLVHEFKPSQLGKSARPPSGHPNTHS